MPVNPIALCPDLQPWHEAGLLYFYFPESENIADLLNPASQAAALARANLQRADSNFGAQPHVAQNTQKGTSQPFYASNAPSSANSANNTANGNFGAHAPAVHNSTGTAAFGGGSGTAAAPAGVNSANRTTYTSNAPAASASSSAQPTATTGNNFAAGTGSAPSAASAAPSALRSSAATVNLPQVQPLNVQALPGPWQKLMQKLRPAPVIWAYAELGHDLMLQGDPKRSAILKHMIGGLRLSAGTSSFLPLNVPGMDAAENELEKTLFWQVLNHLKGRVVVILGQQSFAASPFAAAKLNVFQEQVLGGKLVLCLPDLATLQKDSAMLDSTIIYLRSALQRINLI
ncbi:hypothetical protein LJB93_01150 [Desulfovibrio sp. OttesenSCG-928-F07]|nr:hypothetical protein [Desulfovibrio sp. OttesenSCG-928-F07]